MAPPIVGIHHVTAIAGDPQPNLDFYAGLLGLRLVKRTVNFDDPGTYHFYFGDYRGRPGTIMTFFPWPHAARGAGGAGMARDTQFSVPSGSLPFWVDRLRSAEWAFQGPIRRFGRPTLYLEDPDGLSLQLVEDDEAPAAGDPRPTEIPPYASISGFHSVTLAVGGRAGTVRFLSDVFGYRQEAEEDGVVLLRAEGGNRARFLEVATHAARGRLGAGTVHHVAFRTPDEAEQREWQDRVAQAGLHPTDVRDRNYFQSIYFREPGGVLFEIATDSPGFAVDETVESLGSALMLPPWMEAHRNRIEGQLPPINVPDQKSE